MYKDHLQLLSTSFSRSVRVLFSMLLVINLHTKATCAYKDPIIGWSSGGSVYIMLTDVH